MDCSAELDGHVAVYAANRALMLDAMPALGLGRIAPPDGAFYIWADVGHLTRDSLGLCQRLLQDTGVATAPGIDFDPIGGPPFHPFQLCRLARRGARGDRPDGAVVCRAATPARPLNKVSTAYGVSF